MDEIIQGIEQRITTLPEEGKQVLKDMYGTDQLKLVGYIVGPEITSAIAGSINDIAAEPQQQQEMPTPPGLGMRRPQ